SLERAGLSWATVDPGSRPLNYWQRQLNTYRSRKPICIGISTTYFVSSEWLEVLIRICREIFPDAKIVAGGYMYGTSSREFLSLSADILCVGEAESRLPEIVRAVKTGTKLHEISGLYIRLPNNQLTLTSAAKPASFRNLPQPDWMLS